MFGVVRLTFLSVVLLDLEWLIALDIVDLALLVGIVGLLVLIILGHLIFRLLVELRLEFFAVVLSVLVVDRLVVLHGVLHVQVVAHSALEWLQAMHVLGTRLAPVRLRVLLGRGNLFVLRLVRLSVFLAVVMETVVLLDLLGVLLLHFLVEVHLWNAGFLKVAAIGHLLEVLVRSLHAGHVLLIPICGVGVHCVLMRIEIVQKGLWVAINLIGHHSDR